MIEIFYNIRTQFESLGMNPPKIVIKHWQDWMHIITEIDKHMRGFQKVGTNLTYCEIYGIVVEYGGEWPHPFDNSDVR